MRNLNLKTIAKLTGLNREGWYSENLYLAYVSNMNLSMSRHAAVRVLVWFLNRNRG